MIFVLYFFFALILGTVFTPIIRWVASHYGIVDKPGLARKIHHVPIPFMGGLAIFASTLIAACVYAGIGGWDFSVVPVKFALGMLGAGIALMVGGVLDDKYTLPAKITWLFPAVAAIIIISSGIGIGITSLTNPFGGTIPLWGKLLGIPASALFVWVWIMGMTYTTKLLDGLDGLAAGVSLIGGLVMFALSLTDKINQPVTATLAIIFVGALAGYLIYAFNPASIFLGEGGSTFLGFFLAVLSVLTGAKIATAVLVMGIPILDVGWAILRRLMRGRSPFSADREHLHFLLLDAGLSQRQAVLVFYFLAAGFGFVAVFLQSLGKLIALFLLLAIMVGIVGFLASIYRRRRQLSSKV
jgi:UDP-GlcNAc:undecaprenyl-phosphate GlcNAc-1-phosphate transferase